jgi:hypothetical protein
MLIVLLIFEAIEKSNILLTPLPYLISGTFLSTFPSTRELSECSHKAMVRTYGWNLIGLIPSKNSDFSLFYNVQASSEANPVYYLMGSIFLYFVDG